MEWSMIDAASGGTLMDKTPMVAWHLISNMAGNTQQFGIRGGVSTSRAASEVSYLRQLKVGESVDRAHVPREATYCRTTSTSCATHQFGRQPYPNQQFNNQQFWRQLYPPNPNQGHWMDASSESSHLSTTRTMIPSTRIPPTTATNFANPTKFFLDRRLGETNLKM
ncbi:hypothetical protein CR513_07954, partial [Mucuna pruriens]